MFWICIQECETYLSCKHLDLTESEKNKGRFWPHFVEWSKSVSIGTLCFFHFCLTPQFLSVKVEFQAARVLASKRLFIHPWKQGIRSKSTRHDQVPGLELYAEGTRVGWKILLIGSVDFRLCSRKVHDFEPLNPQVKATLLAIPLLPQDSHIQADSTRFRSTYQSYVEQNIGWSGVDWVLLRPLCHNFWQLGNLLWENFHDHFFSASKRNNLP